MTILAIILHCLFQSIRHPKTIVVQKDNPGPVNVSPVPWWGSSFMIIVGIVSWCLATHWGIEGLDEAARAMVYIPLGNMFGMGLAIAGKVQK